MFVFCFDGLYECEFWVGFGYGFVYVGGGCFFFFGECCCVFIISLVVDDF